MLAAVHNDAVEQGKIEVTLKTTIAGRTVTDAKSIDVTAKGLHEVSFSCELGRPTGEEVKGPTYHHKWTWSSNSPCRPRERKHRA